MSAVRLEQDVIESSCHCGAVKLQLARPPETVTDCNCSICRRYGVLWAYYTLSEVTITGGATDVYRWGEEKIEFHRCARCGCVTHWYPVDATRGRMGANARLLELEVLGRARVRHLDGAKTEQYLD